MSEQMMIMLNEVQERLKKVEKSNKDIRKIQDIQRKTIKKLIEKQEKSGNVEMHAVEKKDKSIRIMKIVAGIVWLACSFLAAMCFGMVSGLRGIGNEVLVFPNYWYAVVFSYILSSGILPAAYLMFGNKITKECCVNTDNSQVTDNTKENLEFGLGLNSSGEKVRVDMQELHSLMIAGRPDTRIREFLRDMIAGLVVHNSSDNLQIIIIDPTVMGLRIFNGLSHMQYPVISDPSEAATALEGAVQEMERRYKLFADIYARDIDQYNAKIEMRNPNASFPTEEFKHFKLPQIIILINELSDLIYNWEKRVEGSICRIAQLGKSTGIHIVIATVNPADDVLTGVIRANIGNGIAFATQDEEDSKRIIGEPGAEDLDLDEMFFYGFTRLRPERIKFHSEISEDVRGYFYEPSALEFMKATLEKGY